MRPFRVEPIVPPAGPTGMRRYLLVALLALTLPIAGCTAGPVTEAGGGTAPPASGSTGAGPSAVPRPSPDDSGAAVPDSTPPAGKPPRRPSTSPSTAVDPENPRDLMGPPVVLTGTVRRDNGCVVLEVDGRRWALTGEAAAQLVDGRRVTVRGRPAAVPAGCDAAFGLALRGTAGR